MSSPSSSSSTKADTSFGAADIDGKTLTQSFQNNCNIGAPSLDADYIGKPIGPNFPAPKSTSLPELSCSVCYRECHARDSCPYFKDLPKGANFDSAKFTAHCNYGDPNFDTDKWVCGDKYCSSQSAKLRPMKCKYCGVEEEHTSNECTVDNHYTARLKNPRIDLHQPSRAKVTRTAEEYYKYKAERAKSFKTKEYLRAESSDNSIPMFI